MRLVFIIGSSILVTIAIFLAIQSGDLKNFLNEKFYNKFDHPIIKLGNKLTLGQDYLQKISRLKFYILVAERKRAYSRPFIPFSDVIETMGGLIEAADTKNFIVREIFDSKNNQYKHISSIIIITDANAKIVGIYPNKKPIELVPILELYPDLVDFSLVKAAF